MEDDNYDDDDDDEITVCDPKIALLGAKKIVPIQLPSF